MCHQGLLTSMILGDCVLATEAERCQFERLIFPNCEAVMWRQAESGGSLMDLRWLATFAALVGEGEEE